MILSQGQILSCLAQRDIVIDPFAAENLKEGSYTFTIDKHYFEIDHAEIIDLRKKQPPLRTREMDDRGYQLKPHSFVLCRTRECLELSGEYSCLLSARGSCAQIGLNALQSSLYAEPGTSQNLMLEVSNVGRHTILLFPGMKIVKGIFLPVLATEEFSVLNTVQKAAQPALAISSEQRWRRYGK